MAAIEFETAIDARLWIVEQREAIREVMAHYCHHAARRDWSAVADLYAIDGFFSAKAPDGEVVKWEGRDAIREHLLDRNPAALPFTGVEIITVNGHEAHAVCASFSLVDQNGKWGGFVGSYTDRYRLEDGRWYIAERIFNVVAVA